MIDRGTDPRGDVVELESCPQICRGVNPRRGELLAQLTAVQDPAGMTAWQKADVAFQREVIRDLIDAGSSPANNLAHLAATVAEMSRVNRQRPRFLSELQAIGAVEIVDFPSCERTTIQCSQRFRGDFIDVRSQIDRGQDPTQRLAQLREAVACYQAAVERFAAAAPETDQPDTDN